MINLLESVKTSILSDKKYREGIEKGYDPINRKLFKQYNAFRTNGAKPIFCYLPYNSLTFSFGGQVFVCSYNRDIDLGRYPANTIDEIWNGEEARKLREHMYYNDLNYGCRHCKFFFEKGKFSNLRPLVFDKYFQNTEAQFPRVFEFELSNECNLECQMCHGEVSSSIRKNREKLPPLPNVYDDAFVTQLEKYIPHLKEAKFYGGEPFLIPIYYKIWDRIKELNPSLDLFVITNGTHWNSKIEKLISELNFDVAISIDAFDKEKVERIRKNVVYEKLIDNIHRFSEACNRKGRHLSLSFTVQKDNWEQLPLIVELCNKVNAYIYVSYLERPVQFALSDLNRDEWKKIRQYMDGFSFPTDSPNRKNNAKCFEDFKHYLDNYINSDETKKYADYKFDRNVLLSTTKKTTQTMAATNVTDEQLRNWVSTQYASTTKKPGITQEEFIEKANRSIENFNDEDKAILRSFIIKTGIYQVGSYLANQSVEQLQQQSKKSLEDYRNQNITTA